MLRSVSVLYPALVVLLALGCAMFWIREFGRRALSHGQESVFVHRAG
ncbi:hypothetical protein BTZ20_2910 [Rhodococcus sp. MTM3W5.2]|nr:hypothetical protein BTZ20_2910 [Rhodococcus sp. MTM3W5.2]